MSAAPDRRAALDAIRAQVLQIERGHRLEDPARPVVSIAPEIDAALPDGGLATGGVHEILVDDVGAATGFAAMLLARLDGFVVWIDQEPDLYPHGAIRFGLQPEDIVMVQARTPQDGLWAMEEALRNSAVAGVVLVCGPIDMTAARRLQLAAEAGGTLGLLLCERGETQGATASLTRWRIAGMPTRDLRPAWRVGLLRSRGGRPGEWQMRWEADAGQLVPFPG